jgi:hypothetical protein
MKEGAIPYVALPFTVPHVHERTLKIEIERPVKLGVLKWTKANKWAAPTFIIPKKTEESVSYLIFENYSKNTRPTAQAFEGFMYATSLDLNISSQKANSSTSGTGG